MERIAVVTDTGSNLSFEEAKELGIYLLPLQITIDDTTYQDTLEISTQDIYKELAQGKMPKTSMAAYQRIYDLFEELKKEYDTVFAVPLTNGLSTNASTMQSIARELEMNVHVIDLYSTCELEKHVAIWIKKLVDKNKSSEEILSIIQPAINDSNSLILVKDLQHLKRGGRLTPMAATLAGLLKIYPVLHINKSTEGRIDVLNKVRTEKRADAYAMDTIIDKIDVQHTHIYIIHSDFLEGANHFKKCFIEKGVPEEHIHINYISSVIAVLTGLRCIAIQYIREEN